MQLAAITSRKANTGVTDPAEFRAWKTPGFSPSHMKMVDCLEPFLGFSSRVGFSGTMILITRPTRRTGNKNTTGKPLEKVKSSFNVWSAAENFQFPMCDFRGFSNHAPIITTNQSVELLKRQISQSWMSYDFGSLHLSAHTWSPYEQLLIRWYFITIESSPRCQIYSIDYATAAAVTVSHTTW